MSQILMVRLHDLASGEIVDRPMTEDELAAYALAVANDPASTN